MLNTDYLVIGSGAASMAFIDTLITEQPDIHITVVDKHSAPGGHWNDAYGYVRLHQPSLVYGVSSEQLEGSWIKLMLSKWTLPWNHRASKMELLHHYKIIMDKWVAQKKVSYYPSCIYNFDEKPDPTSESNKNIHTFTSLDGSRSYKIQVDVKLVNGVLGECKVPSQHAPEFHIDKEGVSLVTPNDIYDLANDKNQRKTMKDKKYVVLGCGKTAMDAVIFLQRNLGVNANNITWIIPNDVWMIRREGPGLPSAWPEALLEHDFDAEKAALSLEQKGALVRLDSQVTPTKYRFAVIGKDELLYMRKVKNIIRQGRVTSLTVNNDDAVLSFQKGNNLSLNRENHVFVHCTSPGPFNGHKEMSLFPSEKEINLWLLFAPPVPISMSCIAVLESRRRKGMLDIDFGRELLHLKSGTKEKVESCPLSDNNVLNELIRGYNITGADSVMESSSSAPMDRVETLLVTALFFGLLDKDPVVAHNWMSSNRLSVLTIPGVKSGVYESVRAMLGKSKLLGLDDGNVEMLSLLEEKLKVLKGK